jgi:glycerophosphoryl diester phosphodiesterase
MRQGVVVPVYPSLLDPPIGFAHRGGRGTGPENTLEAFALALRLGATGLETDAWVTLDGVVVLDHDGTVGARGRRRSIRQLERAALPAHIPSLDDLLGVAGIDVPLSIDVKDPGAAEPIVRTALAADHPLDALFLCGDDPGVVSGWVDAHPGLKAVVSTRLRALRGGPERHVAALADAGVAALNMPYGDWTAGLTTLCHRFGLLAFAWDANHPRQLDALLGMGCDAVYADHPDRLADALARLRAR